MGFYDDEEFQTVSNSSYTVDGEPISIWGWVGILIVLAIPLLNILALIFMAFTENKNLSNFAKASLILMVIGVVFTVLLSGCSAF